MEQLGYDLSVVEDILRDANEQRAQLRMSRWTEKDWDTNIEELDESPHYTDYENTDWEHDYDDEDLDDGNEAGSGQGPEDDGQHAEGRVVSEMELFRVRASQRPVDEDYFGPNFIYLDLKIGYMYFGRIVIKLSRFNPVVERHFMNLAREEAFLPQYNLRSFENISFYKKCDKFFEAGVMVTSEVDSIYRPQPVVNSAYYDKYTMIANENINDSFEGGRFFIIHKKLLHCDPRNIPVGVVVKGRHLIDRMSLLPCQNDGHFTFNVWVESCGTLTKHDLVRGGGESWERPRAIDNFIRLGAHLRKRVRTLTPRDSDAEHEDDSDGEEENRSRPRRRIQRRRRRRNVNREATRSP